MNFDVLVPNIPHSFPVVSFLAPFLPPSSRVGQVDAPVSHPAGGVAAEPEKSFLKEIIIPSVGKFFNHSMFFFSYPCMLYAHALQNFRTAGL